MSVPSDEATAVDAGLIAAYRSGQERAADDLVRRHAQPLARYLGAMGVPSGEVEDLVQETFFRAFRALDSWRGQASFRGWLFRIAANLRKDQFRRERGRIFVSVEDQDLADRADPAGEVGARDLLARLEAAVARLPRLQRAVFVMRVHLGMEYEEICAALGTSAGAARVHYHHAVRRLKELDR